MERSLENGTKLDSSMLSILKILSTFSDSDPLLKDFLQCTIKDPLLMASVSWYYSTLFSCLCFDWSFENLILFDTFFEFKFKVWIKEISKKPKT